MFLNLVSCSIIILNKSCKEVFLKEILIGQEQEVYWNLSKGLCSASTKLGSDQIV